ncbi:MAG TPA: response regulator [Caulobacteraceae bacterium]
MRRGTVHIVDDDPAIGRALALVAKAAGIEAEAHVSAEAFLDRFDPETTGCLVTDVRMPGMNGLELQRAVKARDAATAVVMISGHAAVSMAVEALKGGAVDFIEKPFDETVFLSAVRTAMATTQEQSERRLEQERQRDRLGQLSAREREVMDLIVAGRSSPSIARALGISVRTVETHRARVMEKMDAGCLADLVRLSVRFAE